MSTAEIKDKLIEKIQSTSDEKILLEATRLLEMQISELETPCKLTEEMTQAIDEAQAQIKNGEILSHEDANKEITKWLGETWCMTESVRYKCE